MRYFGTLISMMLIIASTSVAQQKQEPWNESQLIAPKVLAERIAQNKTVKTLILSIGPDALIKGSVDIGPANESENKRKLKTYLSKVPKDKEVVIYCGCCPFDKCPNIRPAFEMLEAMGFKNAKLLDLPKNIKVDWLDKNYPTQE